MVEGGEDPAFRPPSPVISASRDIGLANPNALLLANACFDTIMKVGWPEGPPAGGDDHLPRHQSQSNSAYMAINDTLELVANWQPACSPRTPAQRPTKLMKQLGYGDNYKYAHDYPGNRAPAVPARRTERPPHLGSRKQMPPNKSIKKGMGPVGKRKDFRNGNSCRTTLETTYNNTYENSSPRRLCRPWRDLSWDELKSLGECRLSRTAFCRIAGTCCRTRWTSRFRL